MKFVKHQIPEGFGSVIQEFEEEAKKADHQLELEKIIDRANINTPRWENKISVEQTEITLSEHFENVMREWKKQFLEAVDEHLENKVAEAILHSSKIRCSIKSTVLNFAGVKVSDDVIEALNKGGNFVLHSTKVGEDEAREKFERELLTYVQGYRKYIENGAFIQECELNAWLSKAIASSEEYHREFYAEMMKHSEVMISRRLCSRNELSGFGSLTKLNLIALDCDKNSGIAILRISDIIEAERKMVEELGGVKCSEISAAEVIENIGDEISKFEAGLNQDARKFLDTYYPSRRIDKAEAVLPFMKLKPKVHKMSEADLEQGIVSKLKYRPVIDSSRTIVHQYSKAIRYEKYIPL